MWKDALAACRKEGADLASVHNIEEHSFIITQSGYCKSTYFHKPECQSIIMHISIIKSLECLRKCIIMVSTQFTPIVEQTIYSFSLNSKLFIRLR